MKFQRYNSKVLGFSAFRTFSIIEGKQKNASLTYESSAKFIINNEKGKSETNYLIDQQRFEV